MARSLNKVMLIGNVGAEPEIRTTATGKRVAKLSLATSRTYNDRTGQKQEKTEWHRLTAWDRTAEIIEQYVHKGDRLYVEGSIEYSQTEDENGKPRYWTDIVVRDMVMLSGGAGGGGGGGGGSGGGEDFGGGARRRQSAPAPSQPSSPFHDDDDDLPF
ncbi:MAG: single-stranded DNA-binding protein [Gemmatimonadota bacterium]